VRPLLLSAVKALAAPPDERGIAIGEGTVDDLALDLDAEPSHDEQPDVAGALDELDALLDSMSGSDRAHLWTFEALAGPEWRQVRAAARKVLALRRE
jgi:hypothetical protein